MTNDAAVREAVLRRLADQLDDAELRRLFPGQLPASLRRIIAGGPGNEPSQAPAATGPPATAAVTARAQGCCRLFTDGASRGNPGQAGAGAVLLDNGNEELAAKSVYLGVCTNNVAEYKALLIGLDEALRHGCTDVAVFLDSELIVRQIQGRYKVKNEALLPLFQQVRERLDRFAAWSITHVPRSQNARADQLANRGIDQHGG